MIALRVLCLIATVTSSHSGGLPKASGISQFWTDDFKIFDQVYGKTSDKELYGTKLPLSTTFDGSQIKLQASEKNARYLPNIDMMDSSVNSFYGDRYTQLFAKSLYDDSTKPSSALQFISFSDFKPISEDSDPDTYTYLKKLESRDKYKIDLPEKGVGGLKSYSLADAEAGDAYKSIQDILDAHEANKGKKKEYDDEENDKRNNFQEKRKHNNKSINNNRNKVRSFNGNRLNTRCNNGRCRKRNTNGARYSLPYIRKIQRIRYSKR